MSGCNACLRDVQNLQKIQLLCSYKHLSKIRKFWGINISSMCKNILVSIWNNYATCMYKCHMCRRNMWEVESLKFHIPQPRICPGWIWNLWTIKGDMSSLHSPNYSYRTPTGLLDSYWILLGLQQISDWLITIQIWHPSPTGVLVNSYCNH